MLLDYQDNNAYMEIAIMLPILVISAISTCDPFFKHHDTIFNQTISLQ